MQQNKHCGICSLLRRQLVCSKVGARMTQHLASLVSSLLVFWSPGIYAVTLESAHLDNYDDV